MTKLGALLAGLCLLSGASASAQQPEQDQNVVRAEAPIVAGNAVNAKKRALADAFRQAAEQALADLIKNGEPMPSPPPVAVAELKASLANGAQRFVRSYRLIDQQTEGGVLKVMVEIDVNTVLLRRELDRARGTGAAQARPAFKPVAKFMLVAGAAPVGALVAKALGVEGVRAQVDPATTEAQLVANASRRNAQALFVTAKSVREDVVRGVQQVPVNCSIVWRLFVAGAQPTQAPAVEHSESEYGFAKDESAARKACLERAAGTVSRAVATTLHTPVVSAAFVTLRLDMPDVGAVPIVLQALKRLGSVTANEVREITANTAEIRVFTRIGGPVLYQTLVRELGGKILLTPTQPPSDTVAVKVQNPNAPPR